MATSTFFGITNQAELKTNKPLLKHATELEHHDVVMVYFCIMQAVKTGFPLAKTEELRVPLSLLIGKLESLKGEMAARLPTEPQQQEHVITFTLRVFENADNEDRSGTPTRKTAQNFYAANNFFNVVKQFFPNGALPEDMLEKQKYAKWKAADITTALRDGRTPKSGGPLDQEAPAPSPQDLSLFPSAPSALPSPSPPPASLSSLFPSPPAADHHANNPASLFPSAPTTPPSLFPTSSPASAPAASLFPSPPPSNPNINNNNNNNNNMNNNNLMQFNNNNNPNHTLFPSTPSTPPSSLFPSPPPSTPSASLFPSPPSQPSPQPFPQPAPQPTPQPAPQPAPTQFPAAPQPIVQHTLPTHSTEVSDKVLMEAQKFARFAVSSLQFEDVPAAIDNLKKALNLLTQHHK